MVNPVGVELTRDQARFFRDEFRRARAEALKDAKAFREILSTFSSSNEIESVVDAIERWPSWYTIGTETPCPESKRHSTCSDRKGEAD